MSVSLFAAAEVALGRQRAPQHEVGDHVVRYLRSANIADGTLDLGDVKSMNFTPAEQRTFRLEPGDVLVTEGSGSRDMVGASAVWHGDLGGTVCFQNTLLRMRPRRGISDGGYLAWWARHAHAAGLMASVASGANILHLGAENLRRLPIELPTLDEQRRIADFLDDQVSRIDSAIARRARSASLLKERWQASLSRYCDNPKDPRVPLKRVAWWREGPGILTEDFREEGTPLLRIANVKGATFTLDGCNYVDSMMARWRWNHLAVHAGELLISGSASAGLAVEVPVEAEGAIPYTGLIRTAPRSRDLDKEFLRFFLLSRAFGEQVDLMKTGIGLQHWGPYHLSQVAIRLPSVTEQHARARVLESEQSIATELVESQTKAHLLLRERKRALITAAVTGEFDVSTASGRNTA